MRRAGISAAVAVTTALGARAGAAETVDLEAKLRGLEHVPAVSTPSTGEFEGEFGAGFLAFELSYADLEGGVQQAHVHFGQARVNGGIIVLLRSNLGDAPEGTPRHARRPRPR